MKIKIVIEVPMNEARYKSKAMRAASSMHGVSSVSIESETKMVVIGDGVDPVRLTASLRKKFDYATILSLEEVKPPPPKEKDEPENPEANNPIIEWHPRYPYWYHECPWRHYVWPAACDSSPSYCTYF